MCPTNSPPMFRKYGPTVRGRNNPRISQGMRNQQASDKQKDITANIISERRAEILGESAIQNYFEENPVRSFRGQPEDKQAENILERDLKIEAIENQFAGQINELNRTSFEKVRYLPPPYVKTVTGVEAMREAHARLQFQRHLEKSKKNFIDPEKIDDLLLEDEQRRATLSQSRSAFDFIDSPIIPSPTDILLREGENIFDVTQTDSDEEKGDPPAFRGRRGPRSRSQRPQIRFGRLIIDKEKLEKNEISLGFHSDTGLSDKPRLRNRRKITPEFKNAFVEILNGASEIDTSVLKSVEKKYLIDFIKESQQHGVVLTGQGLFKNIKEIIQRFDILTGMIRAGNNSKKIVNELSSVINQLVQTGTISVEHAINVTKSLIANI